MSTYVNINAPRVSRAVQARAKAGVQDAAHMMVAHAVPLTPLGETGNLRQSIGVSGPMVSHGTARAGVRSDGVVYARRQHEETTWRHPRAGQAKYLEATMQARRRDAEHIIRNHIAGRF